MKIILIVIIVSTAAGKIYPQESAQTPVPGKSAGIALPDISLVVTGLGEVSLQTTPDTNLLNGSFGLAEAEIVFQGYLYPGIRADTVFAISEDGIEVEEAYASFLSVLDFFSIKLGKMRLDFGRLNHNHPHTWSFASTPLPIHYLMGDELIGSGVAVSMLFPLPFFLQLDLNVWKFDAPEDPDPSQFIFSDAGGSAKFFASFAPGDESELQIGLSAVYGPGQKFINTTDNAWLFGCDLSLRVFPSTYERLLFQNEFFWLNRVDPLNPENTYNRYGFYDYLGYRFDQHFELGARFDMSQTADAAVTDWKTSIEAIATYNLTEATIFRLEYAYDFEETTHSVSFQFVLGLGPHTHPIQ
jgi:hypothetical protein